MPEVVPDQPVYASFDVVPSPKGAAVHIGAFCRALGPAVGGLALATLAPPPEVPSGGELWPGVFHHPLQAPGEHHVARVLAFRGALGRFWAGRRPAVAHVRSIYEGYPLAREKQRLVGKLVAELNGLPSIELKYHHPHVAEDRELLRKLRAQEDALCAAADRVIVVSEVSATHLRSRGVAAEKLRVIPNGVDLAHFPYRPWTGSGGPLRLLYAGTLSAWQGVPVLLEALALLVRDHEATLTLVGPSRARQRKHLLERAYDLGVHQRLTLLEPVDQAELGRLHHTHDVAVAPLMPNDRNRVQGACPLKVLEAMATGTPVVASDLEVVRELAVGGEHLLLVKPGAAKSLKDALVRLITEPGLGAGLARAARAHVEAKYPWERAQRQLLEVYRELGL